MKKKSELRFWNRIQWREVWITVLIILVLVLVATFYGHRYYERIEARSTLAEAKNVQLTFRLLATETYGQGESMRDDTRESGLVQKVEEEVTDIPNANGSVQALGWVDGLLYPESFLYQNGDYVVVCRSNGGNDYTWQVYHADRLLDIT